MIKIYQVNDINPELLEPQLLSFKKYMQEDFEFIVFNNEELSNDPELSKEVSNVCNDLGIQVIAAPRDSAIEAVWMSGEGTISQRQIFSEAGRFNKGKGGDMFNYTLQWAWEKAITKERGPIAFIHTDVFLMEPIKLTDYLREQPLCSSFKSSDNISHIWEALLLADIPKLPSPETMLWFPGFVEGEWFDTGGPTYHWLKAHPEVKYLRLGETNIADDPALDFHPSRYQFFELPDGKKVFHYLSGSKWFTDMYSYQNFSVEKSNEYHEKKLAFARKVIGV